MSVEATNLVKSFGQNAGAAAVGGVSFSAPEGKVTSLLGPSGSGKSTLLRMIAGLEEPDSGSISIAGADVTRVPVKRREVGFVFQSYALFKHMTVRDNIAFGMEIRKAPKSAIDARVKELLSLIQLEGYESRFPAQLSGGQRQRIALARALATEPKVLLLDEPFGALDAQVRVELREWLSRFHEKTRVTTLLVTHDQEEALELSQHVVLLNGGLVAQAGAPHELYDHPASPFVASFLGGANVMHSRAQDGREVSTFVRPHDVRLAKPALADSDLELGTVERLARIGGNVKLTVTLPSGDAMSVQVSKLELDQLGISLGDRVMVDVTSAKVFVDDYAI
ncbi:MAG TPA: sulfate ABC transporter ATP-binding protein [Polyangiaceae bacterium]|nr:sulfate ABC transporter ATP-binding protein [Polyangiaceae bacterium]